MNRFVCMLLVLLLYINGAVGMSIEELDFDQNGILPKDEKLVVHVIDDDNWRILRTDEWVVYFFVNWSAKCNKFEPAWKRFTLSARALDVKVAHADVSQSLTLIRRFSLSKLPTIYHVKDGEFRLYEGIRDNRALLFYLELQLWKHTKPTPTHMRPDSPLKTISIFFFNLHQIWRNSGTNNKDSNQSSAWSLSIFLTMFTNILLIILYFTVKGSAAIYYRVKHCFSLWKSRKKQIAEDDDISQYEDSWQVTDDEHDCNESSETSEYSSLNEND